LNYTWYIEGSDARTPDTHVGEHRQYHAIPGITDKSIQWALFDQTAHWSYEPWSDPQGWSTGVQSRAEHTPGLRLLRGYWLGGIWYTLTVWLQSVLLFVVLPVLWIGRRSGWLRNARTEHPNAVVLVLLGVAGVAQFIAVHAEPRLIAPFALVGTIGVVS